ncbi:hypothetical protein AMTRI_Chr10g990 [Amborella trichopoda]
MLCTQLLSLSPLSVSLTLSLRRAFYQASVTCVPKYSSLSLSLYIKRGENLPLTPLLNACWSSRILLVFYIRNG